MKFSIKLSILLTLICLFTVRCANISAPTGGPRDSLPPIVVRTTPAPYTTNFKGKKILIEFDEYIKLKDQQKLFFVSPPGVQKPLITVKGKGLEIMFENSLDSLTTYRLDFGSSITDNNEGNPLHGYSFVFSTGPYVDSLVMAGQTLGAYERDSVKDAFIFYFDAKADSLAVDSTMFNAKTEALFRSDSSGYFIADILKDKNYRVYALDDKNGNQRYEAGTDRIGFSDRIFNPTELSGFSMAFDPVRKYMKIDSLQVVFDLFKEIPVRRQLLTKQERTHRQKITMTFNALNPKIDSLMLGGIDSTWIIREDGVVGDTVTLWISPQTKEQIAALADTIRGTMVLEREDSVWKPYRSTEKLTFTHKIFEPKKKKEAKIESTTKRKRKAGKHLAADTTKTTAAPNTEIKDSTEAKKKKNTFKMTVVADNPLNPEKHIAFEFGFPLRSIDSSRIELIRKFEIEQKGKNIKGDVKTKEEKVPFTLYHTPENIRRWIIRAAWKKEGEYSLLIPEKVFEDITFESNDTLKSTFTIADPEKFGSLIIKTQPDTTYKGTYVLELMEGRGEKATIIDREKNIVAGQTIEFSYLKAGTYSLRIVQDKNANGKWDTGSLTERRQSEKVRMVTDEAGEEKRFIAKENWAVEEDVNLSKMFER